MTDTLLIECPVTTWTVQAIPDGEPIDVAGMTFVWVACPVCDADGHGRGEAGYSPARPGPHLVALRGCMPPPVWTSRQQEVTGHETADAQH